MNRLVIGLGHVSRSGKDTVADCLLQALASEDIRAAKISLAYGVKKVAHELFAPLGVKASDYYVKNDAEKDTPLPNTYLTPRDIWIVVGDTMRSVWPEVWISYLSSAVTTFGAFHSVIIIPDVRYPNEANYIRDQGGLVFNVDRGLEPQNTIDRQLVGYNFDLKIPNFGNLTDLERVIKETVFPLVKTAYVRFGDKHE